LLFFLFVYSIYWLLNNPTSKKQFLVFASLLFYASWSVPFLFHFLFVLLINYYFSIWIRKIRSKTSIGLCITLNLINLGFFKYFYFLLSIFSLFSENQISLKNSLPFEIILPLAISFYTFQIIAYQIDIYRGKLTDSIPFYEFYLFFMFFPQLIAGPILRASEFLPQFKINTSLNKNFIFLGFIFILTGITKKVLIADNLSVLIDPIWADPSHYSASSFFMAVNGFSWQIYCDFSGYSDIAVGAARVMGFRLMENFKLPYRSTGVGMFWSKWHISLSTWFRDYVYIPLGGNRKGAARTSLNLFIVFAISGFWHGANWTFVVWGMAHGLWLVLENRMKIRWEGKSKAFIGTVLTFAGVSILWIFFRASSFDQATAIIKGIITFQPQSGILPSVFVPLNGAVIIGKILMLVVFVLIDRKATEIVLGTRAIGSNRKVWFFAALLACLALLGQWGKVDFIYFQF
jgi:D-alanyl-lipoteichoic acid acyltransferase DltB (MBOAT superfamily)